METEQDALDFFRLIAGGEVETNASISEPDPQAEYENRNKVLEDNGWVKIFDNAKGVTRWEHPDYDCVRAKNSMGHSIEYFIAYFIESSYLEKHVEYLEIPSYLIGRISISNENLAEGQTYSQVCGETPTEYDQPAYYFTKYNG